MQQWTLCNAEAARSLSFFDEMRDRPDVQPLSFNIDREIGEVAPFLRQQGYTFPVLLASSCVDKLLGEVGIPQVWMSMPKANGCGSKLDSILVVTNARKRSGENRAYKSIAVNPEVLFGR